MTAPTLPPLPEPTLKPQQVVDAFNKHFPKSRISQAWIGFAADLWTLGVQAQAALQSAAPAEVANIERKVYKHSAEHIEYLSARFAPPRSMSFEWDGHRWAYQHTSFDDSGEYDLLWRPATPPQAAQPARVKCDGNHGGPRCADPECWNDSPAQPAALPAGEVTDARDIISGLIEHIERNTCTHEETHRGGVIWEICDHCGAKWADDEGGKPEFVWPAIVEQARAVLALRPSHAPAVTEGEREARDRAKRAWMAEPDDTTVLEAFDRGWADALRWAAGGQEVESAQDKAEVSVLHDIDARIEKLQANTLDLAALNADCQALFKTYREYRDAFAELNKKPTAAAVPDIDYTALVHEAWGKHKYAAGTRSCVAFKEGAEWFRSQALAAAPQPKEGQQ